MPNSFMHTVATPRKKVGRDLPSSTLPAGVMVTKLPAEPTSWPGKPDGYISAVDGAKTAVTRPCPEEEAAASSRSSCASLAQSASHVTGYEARASLMPNCAGLT